MILNHSGSLHILRLGTKTAGCQEQQPTGQQTDRFFETIKNPEAFSGFLKN